MQDEDEGDYDGTDGVLAEEADEGCAATISEWKREKEKDRGREREADQETSFHLLPCLRPSTRKIVHSDTTCPANMKQSSDTCGIEPSTHSQNIRASTINW